MPRIFKHLEAGCLQVNLMSTSAQINQLKHTILYYNACLKCGIVPQIFPHFRRGRPASRVPHSRESRILVLFKLRTTSQDHGGKAKCSSQYFDCVKAIAG